MCGRTWKLAVGSMILAGALVTPIATVWAQPAPTVAGKTVGQWSAVWWQWALSIPNPSSPLLDPTGAFCNVGQQGQVWFLAGLAPGGIAERTCTIPNDQYIFFPIVNSVWVNSVWDDPNNTEADYRQYAEDFLVPALGGDLEAWLDGVKIVFNPGTPIVRTQSPVFTINFPLDNLFGVDPAGLTGYPSVSDGFWVMLPPLPAGLHHLFLRAGAAQNITYHLNVVGPPPPHALTITVPPAGTPNPSAAGQPVPLSVTVVDTHGHPLQYLWQVFCAEVNDKGTLSPGPTAPAPTWLPPDDLGAGLTCLIRVTVIDSIGAGATASFVQRVQAGS